MLLRHDDTANESLNLEKLKFLEEVKIKYFS
jgi:hypothetical protein